MRSRDIESDRSDYRFRAEAVLSTGKVVEKFTEWKPYQFDRESARVDLLRRMTETLQLIHEKYGVESDGFKIVMEERRVLRVIETETNEKLFSHHTMPKGTT